MLRPQYEEVDGLLQVAREEQEISGERTPWGEIKNGYLTVWDHADASDDLEHRTETFEANYSSEGMKVGAQAATTVTIPTRAR